jgi:RNA polymerase sigma factor (sigma-70 family)
VDNLTKIAKHHKTWLSYLYSLGCNNAIAEDIVQSMYIKVDAYLKRHNADIMFDENEVNFFFFWVTLKNMYTDYHRKKSKDPIVYVEEVHDVVQFEEELKGEDYDMHRAIMEWFEDKDYEEMCESEDLIYYDQDKLNRYYLRKVFEECFLNGKKLSELSRDTNITYWSLRNTMKIIKKQIKKNYEARNNIRKDI